LDGENDENEAIAVYLMALRLQIWLQTYANKSR
jgi:hypothetical protein